jgi:hypothetical protein
MMASMATSSSADLSLLRADLIGWHDRGRSEPWTKKETPVSSQHRGPHRLRMTYISPPM